MSSEQTITEPDVDTACWRMAVIALINAGADVEGALQELADVRASVPTDRERELYLNAHDIIVFCEAALRELYKMAGLNDGSRS
jgi:hypothetical protein